MFGFLGSPCHTCASSDTHSTYRSFFCGLSGALRDDYSPAAAQLNVSVKTLSTLTLEIPPFHEQHKKGQLLRIAHEVRQSARDAADLRYQIASQIAFP